MSYQFTRMSLKSEGKNLGRFDWAVMIYTKRESKLSGKRANARGLRAAFKRAVTYVQRVLIYK